jgi:hypothetical protein
MFKPYFESQELTFLAAVLERACLDAGIFEEREREVAAARIVRLAQTGEEDFDTLRKRATKSAFRHSFESLHGEASDEPHFRRSFSKLLELSAA